MKIRVQLAKLIDVKSIITIILTVIFAVLAIKGDVMSSEFLSVFTMVIGFYFGVQHEKSKTVV